MKLVDVNLLVSAYDEADPLHTQAKTWLTITFNGDDQIGIARSVALAFVRIVTNPRVFRYPFSVVEALSIIQQWMERPNVVMLLPTERHWEIFAKIAIAAQARGQLAPDADLAASAREHGAILCTHDRSFSRFAGLRVEYPLA